MVSCNDLMRLNIFKNIKLVGGAKGIYKNISWTYICQTLDFSKWVNGGELMFLTGIGMELDEEKIIRLIYECANKDISGLVILINNNYIKKISEEIIKVADKVNLPLFEMPWNIKLIDVNKEIANYIIESNLNKNKESILFQELIFSQELDKDKIKSLLSKCNISIEKGSFVAIVNLLEDSNKISGEYILNMIKDNMYNSGINLLIGVYNNCVICIFGVENKDDFNLKKKFLISIYKKISANIRLSLSIGTLKNNIFSVKESYDEANKAFLLYKSNGWNLEFIEYDKLGFYKILFEINNKEKIRLYCYELLGDIIDYDLNKNTSLLETLKCYLINNCNLIKTSNEMFIHRNTLIYRLNKIRAILNYNLEDTHYRNELINGIMMFNYIKYIDEIE